MYFTLSRIRKHRLRELKQMQNPRVVLKVCLKRVWFKILMYTPACFKVEIQQLVIQGCLMVLNRETQDAPV